MDVLRTFHTADVRISTHPDTLARVRWYKAPDGALPLPTAHAFGCGPAWETGARDYPTADLGQVDVGRKWDKGLAPAGVTGQETPTPLEWYRSGVPAEAIADPPVAKCVMEADLTNNTVTLGPTGIIVGGPGAVTISPPPPPAVQPPPVVITVPITIGGPLIIGGPGGALVLPPVEPVNPVDGQLIVDPADCRLRYWCAGAWRPLSPGGPMPTTQPAAPVDGSYYLDPADCTLKIRCGGAWVTFSPVGGVAAAPTTQPGSPSAGYFSWDPTQGQLSCFGEGGWWVQSFLPPPP